MDANSSARMSTGKDGEDSPATCSRQASGSTRERLAILQAWYHYIYDEA